MISYAYIYTYGLGYYKNFTHLYMHASICIYIDVYLKENVDKLYMQIANYNYYKNNNIENLRE